GDVARPVLAERERRRQAEGEVATEGSMAGTGDELRQRGQRRGAVAAAARQLAGRPAGEQGAGAVRRGPDLGDPDQVAGSARPAEIDAEDAAPGGRPHASWRSTSVSAASAAASRTAARSPVKPCRSTRHSRPLRAAAI